MSEHNDHFIFEHQHNPHKPGGKSIRITSPSQVLRIHDKEELEMQLKHYSRGILGLMIRNSQFARRWHVEKVRPALRYYCKKYQVKIPHWLENDDEYRHMSDEEKTRHFGTTKLSLREFTPLKRFPGGTTEKPAP